MTSHEHMRDAISSSGPRPSNESSSNQNGSGNFSKQQISYKAIEPKDSEAVNETNSTKQQVSFSAAESKDSNDTNENERTKIMKYFLG